MTRDRQILVYYRAEGFVHISIPDAVEAIRRLGRDRGFGVEATDDPDVFSGDLGQYAAIAFVHTSGNVLPEQRQRDGLERFMAGGGGFFGIHAASSMAADIDTDWPWFRELVGASFKGHTIAKLYSDNPIDERPGIIQAGPLADAPADAEWIGTEIALTGWEAAIVHVEDPGCAAISGIVDGDTIVDEWYGFHENPRPLVNVVATVDEATYEPYLGEMGDDHPIVWWREFGGGRTVYNAMGHSVATWRDERFLRTIAGGIDLAAGFGH
jgi:cytochrome c